VGACMVFKQVHMRVVQDAVGADDAVDMGGFCTLHASFADMHMAFQNRAYGIPKQGIWHPKTGHMLYNGHSTLHVVCTPEQVKSSETHLSR